MKRLLVLLLTLSACGSTFAISDASYYDRVRGAWLGKCIGGALGMPVEGWRYSAIAEKYPKIEGYLGYFTAGWKGWSGVLQTEQIPADNEWHRLTVTLRVPHLLPNTFPLPIIGMDQSSDKSPGAWQIRSVKILRPLRGISFDADHWRAGEECAWVDAGTARLDYKGVRSWIRLNIDLGKALKLKESDQVLLSLEARRISGTANIGFAFDYLSDSDSTGFGPDDDTSYQIVGLHTLEKCGPDISCKDIGKYCCDLLPAISNQLAEGLALERMRSGIDPPKSGEHPIGEAIGGQMKGEIWGLICPGRPDLAAEYARRDGVVMHCGNGVYGEQFIAAMIAQSFVEKNVKKLIESGLSVIPSDSEYAKTVRWVMDMQAKQPDYRDTCREIVARYPAPCNPVYGDCGLVVLALLYGGGDFEKSICIAASCGSDTDCNTASVGALLGCIHGAKALPRKWTEPISDTFRSFVTGYPETHISDLSTRICRMGRRTLAYHGKGIKFAGGL